MADIILNRPIKEGERTKALNIVCDGCFLKDLVKISEDQFYLEEIAKCPNCGNSMFFDRATLNLTINARGAGASSGTVGDRKKRMMLERSEKLKHKQWEDHEPPPLAEGSTLTNPTEGGLYDPNGPFVKPKKEVIINTPTSTVKTES